MKGFPALYLGPWQKTIGVKREAFWTLGAFCNWCGCTDPAKLTVDHLVADVPSARGHSPYCFTGLWTVLRQGGAQVLCRSCNSAKSCSNKKGRTLAGFDIIPVHPYPHRAQALQHMTPIQKNTYWQPGDPDLPL